MGIDGCPVVIAQMSEYCQLKWGTLVSPIFILYYQMCICFKWCLAIGGENPTELQYQLYPGWNCSIYLPFISVLPEDFHFANKLLVC